MDQSGTEWWTKGFVAIADVVGFSEREGPEQLRVVAHLDAMLCTGLERMSLSSGQYAVNFTGDGFLLAIPHESRVRPEAFLEFWEGIVLGCGAFVPGAGQPFLHVRVGIHAGSFHLNVRAFGHDDQIVGVAPNWCARVASVAGASQIIVSEPFFSDLAVTLGAKNASEQFVPEAEPMDIPVKHGRMLEARLRRGAPFSVDLSPRLLQLQEAHGYLQSELRRIVNTVGEFFEGLPRRRAIAVRLSRPRITLWALKDTVLEPTAYRFASEGGQSSSATRYVANPPQGPIARCLLTRKSTQVIGLPNYRHDPNGYVDRLAAENLSPAQIHRFGSKSQAFIGVPCGLGPESIPSVALCLDLADPLHGLEAEIAEVTKGIELRAPRIGALWALRTV